MEELAYQKPIFEDIVLRPQRQLKMAFAKRETVFKIKYEIGVWIQRGRGVVGPAQDAQQKVEARTWVGFLQNKEAVACDASS